MEEAEKLRQSEPLQSTPPPPPWHGRLGNAVVPELGARRQTAGGKRQKPLRWREHTDRQTDRRKSETSELERRGRKSQKAASASASTFSLSFCSASGKWMLLAVLYGRKTMAQNTKKELPAQGDVVPLIYDYDLLVTYNMRTTSFFARGSVGQSDSRLTFPGFCEPISLSHPSMRS